MNKGIIVTIVICTIAIIATVIYTQQQPDQVEILIGGKTLEEHDVDARSNRKKVADIFVNQTAKIALVPYRLDVGRYPTTEEGLDALVQAPSGKEDRWKGPYLESLPSDPWGRPYEYRFPGTLNDQGLKGYDIWSLGEDGRKSADDIGNWN